MELIKGEKRERIVSKECVTPRRRVTSINFAANENRFSSVAQLDLLRHSYGPIKRCILIQRTSNDLPTENGLSKMYAHSVPL